MTPTTYDVVWLLDSSTVKETIEYNKPIVLARYIKLKSSNKYSNGTLALRINGTNKLIK